MKRRGFTLIDPRLRGDDVDLNQRKTFGFTLIELLVVIAIIAILAVVVVLTLNPSQLIVQARDSGRLASLANLQTALNLYVADAGINGTVSLGSSNITYLSIPDPTATTTAGTDCTGIGFPSGSFHCPASSTYEKVDSTGWIPVNLTNMTEGAPIGTWPIDPVNQTSSDQYYSYATNGTTWKVSALPESQKYASQISSFSVGSNPNLMGGFPNQGWIQVPGNSTFGTSNFSVMKYAAVCSDQKGNYLNDYDSGYHTYSNTTKPCIPANGRQIASLPGGWPIANISQTSAASYCASIGAHLITNNEWQTIAWNAMSVASNWNGGVVGTSYLFSGHNDNSPAYASPADPNDANGYAGTDAVTSQRRTLTLSNGQVIWDMAGNVWQWTNNTITGTNEPYASAGGFAWSQFSTVTNWGTMTQQTAGASNVTWNSSQGIGELYSEGQTDATTYGFIRGGDWAFGSDAGVEAMRLNFGPTYADTGFGFRCSR